MSTTCAAGCRREPMPRPWRGLVEDHCRLHERPHPRRSHCRTCRRGADPHLCTRDAARRHDGYDGVMLGLPTRSYHLEFTQHRNGQPCRAPSLDNLLVLYVPRKVHLQKVRRRLERLGYLSVLPENSYWLGKSVTFEDPDGW